MYKIVVITPVRNEAWILDRFLSVTSTFADLIIIADQKSDDTSREICSNYAKVHLIQNESDEYDEKSRQELLIETARRMVPGDKIILALDADEILAADVLNNASWQKMHSAEKGTVLYFEKPLLYKTPYKCMRFRTNLYPLGFVDDGRPHLAKRVHSIRIPIAPDAPKLFLNDIIFIHYAVSRPDCQRAKCRLYAVIENIHHTIPFHRRIFGYGQKNYINYPYPIEDTPKEWFSNWEQQGIDMTTIQHSNYYWNDVEVLRMFRKYGTKKFWIDDIWDADWEGIMLEERKKGNDEFNSLKIVRPPVIYKPFYWLVTTIFDLKRKYFPVANNEKKIPATV